jgi:hypothetical protein
MFTATTFSERLEVFFAEHLPECVRCINRTINDNMCDVYTFL